LRVMWFFTKRDVNSVNLLIKLMEKTKLDGERCIDDDVMRTQDRCQQKGPRL
jgi:hypothetical protein